MTEQILEWLFRLRGKYEFAPGRVLEIGSQDINGSVRPLFSDASEYIATDMMEGKGVDRVMNNHDILHCFGTNSFDTIIACETLEHDSAFWITLMQMHTALRPGGHLLITVPRFGFPEHSFPAHYWNFGEDAYRDVFFAGMEIVDISVLDNAYAPKISLAGLARSKNP